MMRRDLYIVAQLAGRWILTRRGQDLSAFPSRGQALRAAMALAEVAPDAEVIALNEDGTAETVWTGERSPPGIFAVPSTVTPIGSGLHPDL